MSLQFAVRSQGLSLKITLDEKWQGRPLTTSVVMPFVKSSAVMAFNGGSSGGGKDGRGGYQPIQGGGGSTDLLGMDANEVARLRDAQAI